MIKDLEYTLKILDELPVDRKVIVYFPAIGYSWEPIHWARNLVEQRMITASDRTEVVMFARSGMNLNLSLDHGIAQNLGLHDYITETWWVVKLAVYENDTLGKEVYNGSEDMIIFYTI